MTWSEKLLLWQNHYFLPLIFHLCQFPIGECLCGLSTTVHTAVQDQLFQSQALAFLASDICPARAPVPTAFAHSPSLSISPLLTVFFLGRHSLKHMVYASAFTAWYHLADCEGCRVWRKDWTLLAHSLTLLSATAFIPYCGPCSLWPMAAGLVIVNIAVVTA